MVIHINYSMIYILSNTTVTSTPGLLAQGVDPQDIRYQSHTIMSITGISIYESLLSFHLSPNITHRISHIHGQHSANASFPADSPGQTAWLRGVHSVRRSALRGGAPHWFNVDQSPMSMRRSCLTSCLSFLPYRLVLDGSRTTSSDK